MKYSGAFLLLIFYFPALSQLNCNVYKLNGDTKCFEACEKAVKASESQGTKESQELFDEAIALCPSMDYAYFEKSVPYLKRGEFIEWKKLIDKAVELDPIGRLGYRGWCRFQFLRDYSGALQDLNLLDSLSSGDLGYSQNGDYHLNIVRALCYRATGNVTKAIELIRQQMQSPNYSAGPNDYLHLGVMQMEAGDLTSALESFAKQVEYNQYLADTYYYIAVAESKLNLGKDITANLAKARENLLKGYGMKDAYTTPVDKVSLGKIENAIEHNAKSKGKGAIAPR